MAAVKPIAVAAAVVVPVKKASTSSWSKRAQNVGKARELRRSRRAEDRQHPGGDGKAAQGPAGECARAHKVRASCSRTRWCDDKPERCGMKTLIGDLTVGTILVGVSAFLAADAQHLRQPKHDDPERLRMIRECMGMHHKHGGDMPFHSGGAGRKAPRAVHSDLARRR